MEQLANGAYVIDSMSTGDDNGRLVLATWDKPGYWEFVTWFVDNDGFAHWGNYSKSLFTAVADYEERSKNA